MDRKLSRLRNIRHELLRASPKRAPLRPERVREKTESARCASHFEKLARFSALQLSVSCVKARENVALERLT
jgi:hypothetical protein